MRIVRTFKDTGRVPNVVNLARTTPATHMLVVRHRDRPGVLAHVFGELRAAGLNVQETENVIFDGAEAAVARINLDGAPSRATVDAVRAHADVLDVQLVSLVCRSVPDSRWSPTCPCTQASSTSPPVPPSCPNPCCSKRSATSSPCRASACRCSRSATARRPSRRILATTEADLRTLGGVPANYKVLFLQGGASLQFSMVPLNLLAAGRDRRLHRHRRLGAEGGEGGASASARCTSPASTESENFARIPRQDELTLTPGAAYVHFTTNNTLFGTEWTSEPAVGDVPLVADTSSDMFSRPIDVAKYGLIYAGAQKNLGPSGVTLVIIREDLLARSAKSLHTMLNYAVHAENGSMYNTPPCFGIYLMGLVMKWALAQGGLAAIGAANARKAAALYAEIDRTGFYRGTAEKDSRSRMNVTFRLPSRGARERRSSRRRPPPASTA